MSLGKTLQPTLYECERMLDGGQRGCLASPYGPAVATHVANQQHLFPFLPQSKSGSIVNTLMDKVHRP